jgi:hypothetical protein
MCLHCHVVTVKVEVNDLDALKAACKRLKWEFCEGQTHHAWYGCWVDDSPVPRNLFQTDAEYQRVIKMDKTARCDYMTALLDSCAHAIKIPGCHYELAVYRIADRWEVSFDWVGDLPWKLATPNEWAVHEANPLTQAYAVELAKRRATELGYIVDEQTDAGGTVHITATHYGS